jgi:hypothetical protein
MALADEYAADNYLDESMDKCAESYESLRAALTEALAQPNITSYPEKDNSVQPVREPANTPLLALREARTRLEWFIDSYPHDIAVSKATFFAGIDEAIATFSQPVREPLTAQVLPDFSPIFGGDK